MKRILIFLIAAVLMLCAAGCSTVSSWQDNNDVGEAPAEGQLDEREDNDGFSYAPSTKADGSKYSIGFIDLDPYPYTAMMLYDVIEGMKADGWIKYDSLPFERENTDAKELINYLAGLDLGPYVRFRSDANYYTLVDDSEEVEASLKNHAAKKDIDIMLSWSTSTTNMVLEYADSFAVIAYPISDPLGSGIVYDVEYSGRSNVWAHTDPYRYQRQMKVFHEVYPFDKMGVIYYDESIAAIADYETGAAEAGVELVKRQTEALNADMSQWAIDAYYDRYLSLCEEMIKQDGIEAFLLTTDMIKDDKYLAELIELCTANGIPIFVQSGDNFVEAGCLMYVEIIDSVDIGRFVARAIEKTLNGAPPEKIHQLYVSTPYLVLNLDAAEKLKIEIPFEMLISSEKIYRTGD